MPQPGALSHRQRAEQQALEGIVERRAERFPEVSRAELADLVHGKYVGYESAPIRDFVPILVERQADRSLDAARHRA